MRPQIYSFGNLTLQLFVYLVDIYEFCPSPDRLIDAHKPDNQTLCYVQL